MTPSGADGIGKSTLEEQRRYYDERWQRERFANRLQLLRAVAILEALHGVGVREPRIVDLGCGTGWLSAILGRFGPTTGVDLSPAAVETARARYPDVRFLAQDLAHDGLDESFDVVVSQEVIEHVEDQAGYVDLCARLLRPGGHLILTTPNAWNLARWRPSDIEAWGVQPIEQWLHVRELTALLARRFTVKRVTTIAPEFGTEGSLRLVNGARFRGMANRLQAGRLVDRLLNRARCGLHLVAVAERA